MQAVTPRRMGSEFRYRVILQEISCVLAYWIPDVDCSVITDSSKCSRIVRNIYCLDRRLQQTTTCFFPTRLYLMKITGFSFPALAFVVTSHIILVRPAIPSKIPNSNFSGRIARNDLISVIPKCDRTHWCFHIKTS